MAPSSDGAGEPPPTDSRDGRRKKKNKQKKDNSRSEPKEPAPPGVTKGLETVYYRTLRGGDRDQTVRDVTKKILMYFGSENPKMAKYIKNAAGGNYTIQSVPTPPKEEHYGTKDPTTGKYSDESKIAYQNALQKFQEKEEAIEGFHASLMLLLGRQCSKRVSEMLENHADTEVIWASGDSMSYLRHIETICCVDTISRDVIVSVVDSEDIFHRKCFQRHDMSNQKYKANFETYLNSLKECGGALGASPEVLAKELGPTWRTQSETVFNGAVKKIRDKWSATKFLNNACQKRYGTLIQALSVRAHESQDDPYPSTLAGAYERLELWGRVSAADTRRQRQPRDGDRNRHGMSYHQDGDRGGDVTAGRGGGRGDRRRGHGGRGGRGGASRGGESNAHNHYQNNDDDASAASSNNSTNDDVNG